MVGRFVPGERRAFLDRRLRAPINREKQGTMDMEMQFPGGRGRGTRAQRAQYR